jgi:hypothetical protein
MESGPHADKFETRTALLAPGGGRVCGLFTFLRHGLDRLLIKVWLAVASIEEL